MTEKPSSESKNLSRILCYPQTCLLYTSDAADERSSVDLGGRRIIKKKTNKQKKKKKTQQNKKKKTTKHTQYCNKVHDQAYRTI